MLLLNSMKIIFSNLGTMWKILLYKLIILLIFFGLFAAVILPQISGLWGAINNTGFFTNLGEVIQYVLRISPDLGSKAVAFNDSLRQTIELIANFGSSFVWVYISFAIIFCVYRFLNSLSDLPLTSVLETNLTSCAKLPLLPELFKNLKKSAKHSAFSLLIQLPSSILIIVIIYFIAQALFSWLVVPALFFIMIIIIILFAFRSTVFAMWRPVVVSEGGGILSSLKTGTKISFKNFWRLYTYYVAIYLAGIFLNIVVAFFTCGAGLIISIPLSIMLVSIFQLVFYFSYKRKKYYLDGDTVVEARLDHTMPDLEPVEPADDIPKTDE